MKNRNINIQNIPGTLADALDKVFEKSPKNRILIIDDIEGSIKFSTIPIIGSVQAIKSIDYTRMESLIFTQSSRVVCEGPDCPICKMIHQIPQTAVIIDPPFDVSAELRAPKKTKPWKETAYFGRHPKQKR